MFVFLISLSLFIHSTSVIPFWACHGNIFYFLFCFRRVYIEAMFKSWATIKKFRGVIVSRFRGSMNGRVGD